MEHTHTWRMSPTLPVTTSTPAVAASGSAECAARSCDTISAESRPGDQEECSRAQGGMKQGVWMQTHQ